MGADKGLSFDFLPELKVCEIHCRKFLQYHPYSTILVCHIWFKIGRYQQCLFVSTNCAIVQKTAECGVVHFLPSEAVIIGASLRAAKWGRQKTGEEAGGAGQVEPSWRF